MSAQSSSDLVALAAGVVLGADGDPLAGFKRRLADETPAGLQSLRAGMASHLANAESEFAMQTAHERALLAAIDTELRHRNPEVIAASTNDRTLEFVRRFRDTIESMPPIAELGDDVVVSLLADTQMERETIVGQIDDIVGRLKGEIERRLRERRAAAPSGTEKIAIPHPRIDIVLEPQYAPYTFNLEKLREAYEYLPEDEAAKIIKFVPEQVTVVPAHEEPGATVSITALAKKYSGSVAGDLLRDAMRRTRLEDKLTIKPHSVKLPSKRAS